MPSDAVLLMALGVLFMGAVGVIYGVWWLTSSQQAQSEYFLRRRLGLERGEEERLEEEIEASLIRQEAADAAQEVLGDYGQYLENTIRSAASDLTVSGLVTQMAGGGVIGAALGFYLAGGGGLMLALPTAFAPLFLLQRTARKRTDKLRSQMPDALELMSRSMQAGIGLSEAFKMAAVEMEAPISVEWNRVYEEVRFGRDWRDALMGVVNRNPQLFELRLLVSSILLQRDTGGNIIETFDNIAKTIRQRYVFDAKVAAMTSEARTSGLVLAGMPLGIVVMIILASPDYLVPLVETSYGHMVIIYCLSSYGIGLYVMKIQSTVEV